MAGLLDDLEYKPWDPLPGRDSRDYYERRMNAGDTFRAITGIGASMAALAVREISKHRAQRAESSQPVAYLLRSFKHPDEVKLLRQVYGEAFSLVGINAARSGVSTQGAILYTTTFPCHECAKMIIGAGIVEVHYIEPYPKSLVDRLYRHLIDTSPPARAGRGLVGSSFRSISFWG